MLQRMICIVMTGCIRAMPMVSLELLLVFFPLFMGTEAEAIICMKRFKYLLHWKFFLDYLSWKNLDREVSEYLLLGDSITMPCDGMLTRYVYDKPYHIPILSRNDWSTVSMHPGRKCLSGKRMA